MSKTTVGNMFSAYLDVQEICEEAGDDRRAAEILRESLGRALRNCEAGIDVPRNAHATAVTLLQIKL